jgi:two-component system, chemotaxis family, sensor histidine kinase and response regulator PixL
MTDSQMNESLDQYFAIESEELIQTIEQTLLALLEEKNIERVHTLMRAAHTIKGGAANCGLKTIETIAHHLEDVFQALYPEELVIDDELGTLLLEGYEVLYTPLSAVLQGYECDEERILEQTADLFARLQAKLGDFFGREAPLPTAEDLGFDIVGLIFGDSVPEDLNSLSAAIDSGNKAKITELLHTQSEFFTDLGASYGLPGIGEIAQATLRALEVNPHQVITIAKAALENLQAARTSILAGDREQGGTVSAALIACLVASEPNAADIAEAEAAASNLDAVELLDILPSDNATDFGTVGDQAEFFDFAETANNDNSDLFGLFADNSSTPESNSNDLFDLIGDTANPSADNDLFNLIGDTESQPANNDLFELFDNDSSAVEQDNVNDLFDLLEDDGAPESSNIHDTLDYESVEILDTSSHDVIEMPTIKSSGTLDEDYQAHEDTEVHSGVLTDDTQDAAENLAIAPIAVIATTAALATSSFGGTAQGMSPIDRILHSISTEISDAQPPQAPPAAPTINANAPTIRVAIERLDRLSHAVSELLIDESQQNNRADNIYQLAKDALEDLSRAHLHLGEIRHWSDKNLLHVDKRAVAKPADSTRVIYTANQTQPGFDMLEMDVYSDLHILIQKLTDRMELLGERLETLESSSQKLRAQEGKRKRIFAVAQDELLQARMEPISTVFDRFPRLVQQMVTKHKKPAELLLVGTAVLVDKSTAEKLYDPLLHLIRNSYDHGLETAEVRAEKGKKTCGQITVSAHHHGNRTTIEVRDNGGGLNYSRIKQKAVEQNLISSAQAEVASEAELSELLFHPGFSTADKVSELSGRGIGLDVVRTQIEALQGSISVRSVVGEGTTFSLQIPLSFTTARLLICKSQGKTYALLSDSVQQAIVPLANQIQERPNAPALYRYQNGSREELIAIQHLGDLVNYNCPVPASNVQTDVTKGSLLMIQSAQGKRCLAVDRLISEQELVITPVGNVFVVPSYIQGSSTLGDGSLTLAIDPVALLDENVSRPVSVRSRDTGSRQATVMLEAAEDTVEAELLPYNVSNNQITLLVVDDSLVQRQGLLRTLSGAGYQVLQAANGQEALAQLNQHHEVQLVVCDIEMPFMNGFEFLSYCRQDARLSQIPTIMLTTRSGAKHRQLAIALGAKAYTTKPHADKELLEAVEKQLNARTPALV